MLHDPLNDAMAVLRNAEAAGKGEARIRPASKLIGRVLNVLQETQYIDQFEVVDEDGRPAFVVRLKGAINDCGVVKPRFAVKRRDLERWEARYLPAQDFGVLILSTTAGVVSNAQAKNLGVGGKVLAYVY
jgi:small subunit ribosomal protein S8